MNEKTASPLDERVTTVLPILELPKLTVYVTTVPVGSGDPSI